MGPPIIKFCQNTTPKPKHKHDALEKLGTTKIVFSEKISELINRPQITIEKLAAFIEPLIKLISDENGINHEVVEAAEVKIKYKGYIERERKLADKVLRIEDIKIKGRFDYSKINQLSIEARQKLERIDPETLAEASRIPGISPSDISILMVLLKR